MASTLGMSPDLMGPASVKSYLEERKPIVLFGSLKGTACDLAVYRFLPFSHFRTLSQDNGLIAPDDSLFPKALGDGCIAALVGT